MNKVLCDLINNS